MSRRVIEEMISKKTSIDQMTSIKKIIMNKKHRLKKIFFDTEILF